MENFLVFDNYLIVIMEDGALFHSSDKGKNWINIGNLPENRIAGVSYYYRLDENGTLWQFGSNGTVQSKKGSGVWLSSLTLFSSNSSVKCIDVKVFRNNHIWAVLQNTVGTTWPIRIIQSKDGGLSWKERTLSRNVMFTRGLNVQLVWSDTLNGIVNYDYGGTILRPIENDGFIILNKNQISGGNPVSELKFIDEIRAFATLENDADSILFIQDWVSSRWKVKKPEGFSLSWNKIIPVNNQEFYLQIKDGERLRLFYLNTSNRQFVAITTENYNDSEYLGASLISITKSGNFICQSNGKLFSYNPETNKVEKLLEQFSSPQVTKVFSFSSTSEWILMNSNELYVTKDEYSTIQFVSTLTEQPYDLYFVDDEHGYMTNKNGLYHTYNGGITWDKKEVPNFGLIFRGLSFESDQYGWFVSNGTEAIFTDDYGNDLYDSVNRIINPLRVIYFDFVWNSLEDVQVLDSNRALIVRNNRSIHLVDKRNRSRVLVKNTPNPPRVIEKFKNHILVAGDNGMLMYSGNPDFQNQELAWIELNTHSTQRFNRINFISESSAIAWNQGHVEYLLIENMGGTSINVDDDSAAIPTKTQLLPNYPNPFNPSTTISFELSNQSTVLLEVFDLLGQRIAVLENSTLKEGKYEKEFNASGLSSGIYIYRFQAGSVVQSRKMVLIK